MKYKSKLVMHGSPGLWVWELEEFPGIMITDIRQKKMKKSERYISFDEMDFKTIADAITAWRGKHGSETNGDKKESQEGHCLANETTTQGTGRAAQFVLPGVATTREDGEK